MLFRFEAFESNDGPCLLMLLASEKCDTQQTKWENWDCGLKRIVQITNY
jgi:hypothetical protein